MAGIDKKLTDLTELTTPSDGSFIHVVEPLDISQSPEGSSYKVKKSNFGGVSDAPSNGTTYGRKDAAWVPVASTDTTADHFRGNWNANTNSPTLTNGVGQVGDNYLVSVSGTQFGIDFGEDDIISYNGATWYKYVDNNQALVLTTNTNITSSVLSTQDVAGFVSYINGLVSSFSLAVNEIRTYTVTDTGQKFEILLRGRSFGGTEPDITSSDVLEIEKGDYDTNYRNWGEWVANNGGGITTIGFMVTPTVAGTASVVPRSSTTIYNSIVMNNYASALPNGSNAGIKNNGFSAGSYLEGWDSYFVFVNNDTNNLCCTSVGFYSLVSAIPNLDPTNFVANTVLVGNDSGDSNLSFFINRTIVTTSFIKIPCGPDFPAHTTTDAYLFRIQIPKTTIEGNRYAILTLTNIVTGKVFSYTANGLQLPTGSSLVTEVINRSNRNTGVSTSIRAAKVLTSRLIY